MRNTQTRKLHWLWACLVAYMALCLFVLLLYGNNRNFVLLVLGAMIFVVSVGKADFVVRSALKQSGEKYGRRDYSVKICFYENELVYTDLITNIRCGYSYRVYKEIYLGKDYLHMKYVNGDKVGDFYIMYRDIADKDGLLDFLRGKCPKIKWTK